MTLFARCVFFCTVFLLCIISMPSKAFAADISSGGWRLWPDKSATWQDDQIYLPADVRLTALPVNPPTGGWKALDSSSGIPVTLPSTVEEHYWGKFGLRPYGGNVADISHTSKSGQLDGSYLGVSWWWKTVSVPVLRPGQHLILHIRGARFRSEVYCNHKLCGYSIMTELPFDSDLTAAVIPGHTALIAIRITNPGGYLDWNDFFPCHVIKWGQTTLPGSHGFGGLDSGVTLSVRDDVSVTDLAAINLPELHTVKLTADVASCNSSYNGPVNFKIFQNGALRWSGAQALHLSAGQQQALSIVATVPKALPWSNASPNLYTATVQLGNQPLPDSGMTKLFGFRFFTAVGIGKSPDPILTFNGKRIVIRSAISWGYWGFNGLWPDAELARREVMDAKQLGLNCLQFHRNIGKPIVLDLQDKLGLLRYEEPGAGESAFGQRYGVSHGVTYDYAGTAPFSDSIDTSGTGPNAEPKEFYEKYEEEKILEMVKRDRSHPSLIMYCIQNEGGFTDLNNPRIYRVMREMRALDPSRIILLNSGIPANRGEALMLPYSDVITHSSGDNIWGGWRDEHSVGGPGNYTSSLYTDPTNYSQKVPLSGDHSGYGTINMWGEMLGVGTPDNYDKLVQSYAESHRTGYDLDDDTNINNATTAFLNRWGFRDEFPTNSAYFTAIGNKCYYFWGKILEQARADNYNDYLVVSGWESTTIDNHSGIVDSHRYFKGDPKLISQANLPEALVVRPRQFVLGIGQSDPIDLYLLNELNRTGPQTLTLTVKRPDGTTLTSMASAVYAAGGNVFGQLLQAAAPFTPDCSGIFTIDAKLTSQSKSGDAATLSKSEQVNVVDTDPHATSPWPTVAVVEPSADIASTIQTTFHSQSSIFRPFDSTPSPAPDVIVLASRQNNPDFDTSAGTAVGIGGRSGDAATLTAALTDVKLDGTRLVLWGNGQQSAHWMLQELANRQIVTLSDWVNATGAPWFGSWYFVRRHWLFDGLPTGVMDWRYDNSWNSVRGGDDSSTGGAVIDAPGLDVACGYGNNNTKLLLGMSACVIPYGKGQIIWYCLPELLDSLRTPGLATDQRVAQRLLWNAICAGR